MSILIACDALVSPLHPQVSITFDPFLYLPVPLPQKQKVLPVFYFAREPHSKPIKVGNEPLPLAILETQASSLLHTDFIFVAKVPGEC